MQNLSYLKSENANYIDQLFEIYSQDPDAVDASWRYFFDGMELGQDSPQASFVEKPVAVAPKVNPAPAALPSLSSQTTLEPKVAELILAYRQRGRLLAHLDPLSFPSTDDPSLELSHYGLTQNDLGKTFSAGHLVGLGSASLKDILALLKETYCGTIGVEFSHIQDSTEREWLQQKMEASRNQEKISTESKKHILKRLTESETFERFLHTRYVAQKRFSIEGAESVIPALDQMLEVGSELGAEEFVFGMAHRGRLNVLTNILGKKPEHIFTDFEGRYKTDISKGEGDVKYHMGFSTDVKTKNGKSVHLSLASNPSHLEFVGAVIEGVARAKQTQLKDSDRTKVIPITIHGDASFAGQGVCYETLNLSQLVGYGTGGTIHVIINNQVGFTTSPKDSRSTPYSTDLAKMLDTPIFHVNGDDVEALCYVSKLCIEYRQKFKKDIFIDVVCYRKHGHNEGDEPAFTQPLLYKNIKSHRSPREIYAAKLAESNVVSVGEADALIEGVIAKLTAAQTITKAEAPVPFVSSYSGLWKDLHPAKTEELFEVSKTAVAVSTLKGLGEKLNSFPSGFKCHPKLARLFETRSKAIAEGKGIDWGNAEALAFASLVTEGHSVRLSGQDAERGTFSHRHSVLHDFETGQEYTPLNHLSEKQSKYEVCNSHLSETAVLAFEYGYSLTEPNSLTIWEAQFGDFANGAQVIIDQFIATGESKWQRGSGLTMLLPHGYEGQAAEHSSARLERFLQLCGRENMFVCNFTTPAQLFHGLRRQMKRKYRKPLVVMSPKSLLRHPLVVSTLDELSDGHFEEVLDDPSFATPAAKKSVKKVILCSGKVYYDLLAERTAHGVKDVALVRVEQLYPFPAEKISKILAQYGKASLLWTQEEPRNMGAWTYIFNTWMGGYDSFQEQVGNRAIAYVGREVCASPAVGSHSLHEVEQEALIKRALT